MLKSVLWKVLKVVGKTLLVLAMCGAAGAACYQILQKHGDEATAKAAAAAQERAAARRRIPVVVSPVARRTFERRVVVQGNVEAKHSALVSPRLDGTIEALFVEEGDCVKAGKTRLFQIDALKLEKTVEIREGELAVARCALREKQANLEKEQVGLEQAELDYRRHKELFERQVESKNVLEQAATDLKKAQALVKHAQSLVDLAAAQVDQAANGVIVANKDLRDALVVSPIDGVVSERYQEPGEAGTTGEPVLRIDDLLVVEVSAFLPAACYPEVVPGQARMRVRVGDIDLGEQLVSYRSPTVNDKLRTFEVKCLVKSPPEGVAPGVMAGIRVVLERREGLGVPVGAVQRRQSGQVVFTIDGEKAVKHVVETGLETDGWIEVQGEGLEAGTPVVTMGQFLLDDGTEVAVQKGTE